MIGGLRFANPPHELRLGLGQQLRQPRDPVGDPAGLVTREARHVEAALSLREIEIRQFKPGRVDHGEALVGA